MRFAPIASTSPSTPTLRALAVALAAALAGCRLPAVAQVHQQAVVRYEVALPAPQTQMVEVTMSFPTGGAESVELLLPTWRPGRYEILDLAGTVRSFQALSEAGRVLTAAKSAKSTWVVETGGIERVRVRYGIYANSLGDRTRHVDATHAFLSGSAVFLYHPPLRQAPVEVRVRAPEGWRVATGLEPLEGEPGAYSAADYDELVDSPLEIGLHDRIEFAVDGTPHEIVIWPPGVDHDPEHLIEDFSKLVRTQTAVFGHTPYTRYVFIVHAGPARGGTEHLNSTIMQASRSALEGSEDRDKTYERFLGLVSHELFHTWNVKSLRPAGLHPYDYQSENYTDLLWVAEGGTSYYGGLTMVRAGLREPKEYLKGLAESIHSLRRLPGARVQSLAESSFDAWIKFNRRSPDDVNTEVSFYGKGSLACLALDMEVRARSANAHSLDDVMRDLFERFPLSGPGYTTTDLVAALDAATGSSFAPFFARHVASTDPLPFEQELAAVGLELRFEPKEDERKGGDEGGDGEERSAPRLEAYIGLRLRDGGAGARVSAVLSDGPAFSAGVIPGDEIIALDGRRLRASELDERLERYAPGDAVTLHVLRNDDLLELRVALNGIAAGKWTIRHAEDATDAQKTAYVDWLGQPWPESASGEGGDGDEDESS